MAIDPRGLTWPGVFLDQQRLEIFLPKPTECLSCFINAIYRFQGSASFDTEKNLLATLHLTKADSIIEPDDQTTHGFFCGSDEFHRTSHSVGGSLGVRRSMGQPSHAADSNPPMD